MAGNTSTTWYKFVLIGFLYIAAFMVFAGEEYLVRMVSVESAGNAEFYGEDDSEKAQVRATRWFTRLFVDTQIMSHSFEMFIPTEQERINSEGMEDFGAPVFVWFEGRMRSWWTIVWSAFVRASTLLLWAPYLLLVVVPFAIDGWMLRERSKHKFVFASTLKHRYALMAIVALPLVALVLITMPVALHPLVPAGLVLALGVLVHSTFAHFMKRA